MCPVCCYVFQSSKELGRDENICVSKCFDLSEVLIGKKRCVRVICCVCCLVLLITPRKHHTGDMLVDDGKM